MRKWIWLAPAALFVVGCMQVDENPDWNPSADYPGWTYDAPFYYRPTEDLKPLETIGYGIGVYYTNSEYFFIQHPGGYQVDGTPRIAVWCTSDRGEHWQKSGYFGVEQSHFLFRAQEDGRYWIRFVGTGQGVSEVPPGMPHRIYVVDRKPPTIKLTVTPTPWKDDGKTKPYFYKVGETVTLRWYVTDPNLAKGTVKLGTCFARFPHNLVWSRFPKELPPTGKMEVEIPPEAVQEGGLRFRMEATDKADNIGMGLTEVMRVIRAPGAETQPTTRRALQFEPVPPAAAVKEPISRRP